MYKITVQTLTGNEHTIYFPGNDEYTVTSAVLSLSVGNAGTFEFTVPFSNPLYNEIVDHSIITVYEDNHEIWRGDIQDIRQNFDKSLNVYCLEDMAWLGEEAVAMTAITNQTYEQRFSAAIAGYNANQVAKRQFTLGVLTSVTTTNTCNWKPQYEENLLDCLRNYIADDGYVRIRRAYSGDVLTRYVDIVKLSDFGQQATQTIEFGSNLLDFVKEMDNTNFLNVLYPYGAETETELYGDIMQRIEGTPIQNDASVAAFGRRARSVIFETESLAKLNSLALAYLNRYSQPSMKMEVKAIDLGNIEVVNRIHLGDSVRVIATTFGIDQWDYVTDQELDLLNIANNQITLADAIRTNSLTSQVIEQGKDIDDIRTPASVLDEAKRNALAIFQGADGGIITFPMNANNQIIGILCANNLDINQATKAIGLNINGLVLMSRTYPTDEWTLGVGITINGAIVADYITAGEMSADRINGGHIKANLITALNAGLNLIESNADYSGAVVPTYDNAPASGWSASQKKANIGKTYYDTTTGKCYQWLPYINLHYSNTSQIAQSASVSIYYRDTDGQIWYTALYKASSIADKWYATPTPVKDIWYRLYTTNASESSVLNVDDINQFGQTETAVSWYKTSGFSGDTIEEVTTFPNGTIPAGLNKLYHITPSSTTYMWVEVGSTLSEVIKRIGSESFTKASSEFIFNKLTNNGAVQGLFSDNGNIYLNAQYIGAGDITIGGSQYADNPTLKVKDTSDNITGTWTVDGIDVNKGNFGRLKIERGTPPDYEDSALYSEGWWYMADIEHMSEYAPLDKNYYKNIEFNPFEDSLIGDDIGIDFQFAAQNNSQQAHESQASDVVCTLQLQRLLNGTWNTIENRQFYYTGIDRNGLDSERFTTTFDGDDNTDYRVRITFIKRSWAQDYTLLMYTDNYRNLEINKDGVQGLIQGTFKGNGSFSSFGIGSRNEEETSFDIDYDKTDGYLRALTGIKVGVSTKKVSIEDDDITKTYSGSTVSVMWDTSSDERLKHDIKPLDVDLSRNLIDATKPKEFAYNYESEGKHYGMIAQDARELLDNLGETDANLERASGVDDYRTINYNEYIPHLINYVKDLRAEIVALKNIINKEEGK